jgi:hypothetical protein
VVLRAAGDVAVHVAVPLEPARHAGGDECLERAKDRRPADAALAVADSVVQLLRGDLATSALEGIGDEQSLPRDPLSGAVEAIGDRLPARWAPTEAANSEKR